MAATTTEIGATSREISATSRELVRTMAEVSGAAEQTASLAGSGQVGLRMEDTMRNVVDAAGSVNAKLAILNEKAGNITQVVTRARPTDRLAAGSGQVGLARMEDTMRNGDAAGSVNAKLAILNEKAGNITRS